MTHRQIADLIRCAYHQLDQQVHVKRDEDRRSLAEGFWLLSRQPYRHDNGVLTFYDGAQVDIFATRPSCAACDDDYLCPHLSAVRIVRRYIELHRQLAS